MILVCGIPTETPLAWVRAELERQGRQVVVFNQRRFADMDMGFSVHEGVVSGWLRIADTSHRLETISGVFTRLMDDARLPELRGEPPASARRQACRALHDTMVRWCEVTPARVVNRMGPMASNASKPFQAQLIRQCGFGIPETLITNDPRRVLEFNRQHRRVVYKSISGVRSIVRTLNLADDGARLGRIRWCPLQLQVFIEGLNVRVHVVGRTLFATAIHTDATDYRYAHCETDAPVVLEATELPAELRDRCLALTQALRLPFAGIDLKLTPDGQAICFEVNPSPAFSYYEQHTGQPIAREVAAYLSQSADGGRLARPNHAGENVAP